MDAPLNHVFFPVSFVEFFAAWNRFPAAVPYAGGTNLFVKHKENRSVLPPVFLCLDKIEELHRITRTEHNLEIGAMVKLGRFLRLGKVVPDVICKCLQNIAGVQLRNIATVGGNICSAPLLDLPAVLVALDAQYELRTAESAKWVLSSRFHAEKQLDPENQELLTRIRLPLYQWEYAVYKKFADTEVFSGNSVYGDGSVSGDDSANGERGIDLTNGVMVFLVKTVKNILAEIRVIYKGNSILRHKESETILNGKHLPLSRKIVDEFIESWKEFLDKTQNISEFSKHAVLNSIEENVLTFVS